MPAPTGPQFIDNDFVDLFTDGSARYSQSGVESIAQKSWKFSITMKDMVFTIRVFLNGVLANVNAAYTVPLSAANTNFVLKRSPNTTVATVPASSWVNATTGVYTVDLSATSMTDGAHVAEIITQATYTNPVVTSKISVITAVTSSYSLQNLTTDWLVASMPFAWPLAAGGTVELTNNAIFVAPIDAATTVGVPVVISARVGIFDGSLALSDLPLPTGTPLKITIERSTAAGTNPTIIGNFNMSPINVSGGLTANWEYSYTPTDPGLHTFHVTGLSSTVPILSAGKAQTNVFSTSDNAGFVAPGIDSEV